MTRGLENLCYNRSQSERVGAVSPGDKKALGRPYRTFQYLKVAFQKAGDGVFTRALSDRTRGNGFKLKG